MPAPVGGMHVDVPGGRDLHALAKRLREARRTDLDRELNKAVRAGAKRASDAITEHAPEYLPQGYEAVFVASLEFKTQIRKFQGQRVTLTMRARGAKGHDRQLRSLERGELRKPVFGRWRRRRGRNRGKHAIANPWAKQRIRPHLVTEPVLRIAPVIRGDVIEAMQNIAAKITDSKG